jgi:hypothetical protein
VIEAEHPRAAVTPTLGRFLVEPKASVLAAKLEESLAVQLELHRFAGGVAYFTTDQPTTSPLVSAFEVLDDFAFHHKALVAHLKARGAQVQDIKKRGVAMDPLRVKQGLKKLHGSQSVVLVFYPQASSIRVAVTRPLRSDRTRATRR